MGLCESKSAVPVLEFNSLKHTELKSAEDATKTTSIESGYSRRPTEEANDDSEKDTISHFASREAADDGIDDGEISDAVGLKEMKKAIRADGSLHETVVRMETPIGIPIEEVYDGVHHGKVLGSGVEGVVRLVKHKTTGVEYASKSIDIGLIKDAESLQKLRNEISIMCQVDHPNIVRLEEVYQSESELFLVQELCPGGDLFDRLDAMPDYHYSENQCARLVKQMLSALLYLHSKNIIHRDLKLENFLFSSSNPDSELKLVDFGLSKHFQFGEVQHEHVGTPYTVAPEVIKGSYDERSDLWAIGVITYLLLSGETPFGGCDGEDIIQVRDNILRGFVSFEPEECWENTSTLSKDFIRKLLVTDYRCRPSARESLRLPWVERVHRYDMNDGSKHGSGINPNVVKSLVSFKEYSVMRKLLLEILSFTLLPEQIIGLRGEFEKLDVDGDGEISLAELKRMLVRNAGTGSLGSLTEKEVEQIFNAMKIRKSEKTIRWHEFIAAGISQCKVDERNLRLAFDRLDTNQKGYITFDNIMDVVGSNGNREELRVSWKESIRTECMINTEQISYDQFVLLMKGQTQESTGTAQSPILLSCKKSKHFEAGNHGTTGRGCEIESCLSNAGDVPARYSVSVRARSMSHLDSIHFVSKEDHKVSQAHLHTLFPPGRRRSIRKVEQVIQDETKSPLVIGKTIYRVNREMRIAVLEAVKRFEREEAKCGSKAPGLVMQRGSTPQAEEELLATAKKQSGRTRHRCRCTSDLTGMLLVPA